ncbi:hypothetical protein BX600DRAFT_518656 [Xylariales sp. PMI_506]|nr:hypothetical protein BX600DRAFT_518656 [Xylariales sp. PMI_506]
MSTKLITVLGATGAQGGSVINSLLDNPSYTLRAVTRRPSSDAAISLTRKGVEVVKADTDDLASLKSAMAGSYAVFAVTDFWVPFASVGPLEASAGELAQGINIAKAAAATPTLEHYIWSTLPGGDKFSGGKIKVPHFDAKTDIEAYIKSDADLLAKTTFLWVGFYSTNFLLPVFKPYYIDTADVYVQLQDVPADTRLYTIGDAAANVGPIVKAVLAQSQKTRNGRYVNGYIEKTTTGQLLQRWARARGKKAHYVQISSQEYFNLWPVLADEISLMMHFLQWAGDNSWSSLEGVLTPWNLGLTDEDFKSVDVTLAELEA